MRVLLITQHFRIHGGSDVIVHHTHRLLEEAGHEVYLFAARDAGTPDDGIFPSADHFDNPRPATIWKFLYSSEARTRLDAFLEAHPVDVAHLHIHYGKLTSSILEPLHRRGIPIVQHLHEYRSFCSVYTAQRNGKSCTDCRVGYYLPGLRYRCNRGSLLRSALSTVEMYVADWFGAKSAVTRFITVSDFQRRVLISQGMPADRISTIYNPVDPMFFSVKSALDGGVIYFGRLEEYKGVFDILTLAEHLPNISFVLIGTGRAEPALRTRIAANNLDNVTLTGALSREELLPYLKHAKVAMVPSRWNETFGLTAVEAMAAGVPVIVSDMGGLPEVVDSGKTGYVVPVDMSETIEVHLKEMCNIIPHDLANAARIRASVLFSEERYRKNLEFLLENVITDDC